MSQVAKQRSVDASERVSKRRPNPYDALGELQRFLNICGDAAEKYNPQALRENIGRRANDFYDGLTPAGKKLADHLAGLVPKVRR